MLGAVLLITVIGSAFGYYYYGEQLTATPRWLWLFVPDCPLYTTLFAGVLIGGMVGVKDDFFAFITSVGLIKYGLWTGFVLLWFSDYFFAGGVALMYVALFLGHIGMWLQGLTLPFRKTAPWFWPAALGWFLMNDVLDYFGPATHPYLPEGDLTAVIIVTFGLTFLALWLVHYLHKGNLRLLQHITRF